MRFRYLFLILLQFISLNNLFSQAPSWNWVKSAGESLNDDGRSVTTDRFGNVYATGAFRSASVTFGSVNLNNTEAGAEDVFVVKYDSAGNVIWAKSAGGSFWDNGAAIATDQSGNVYVAGGFRSSSITFGSVTLTSKGLYDIFLVKYDATGDVVWAKNFGGSDGDNVFGMTADEDGNCYLTGHFTSNLLEFDNISLDHETSDIHDVFIAKINAAGKAVWAKKAGGNNMDAGEGVFLDAYGNLYVTGYFRSDTAWFENTPAANSAALSHNLFLAKYDTGGKVKWVRSAGGPDKSVIPGSLSADSKGNVYVSGGFMTSWVKFGSDTLKNTGNQDLFFVKYDSTGNVVWAKGANGANYDLASWVSIDSKDNIYLGGFYSSLSLKIDSLTMQNPGVFIIKYDDNGDIDWFKKDENAVINGMTLDQAGNIYATGTLTETASFDNHTFQSKGYSDIFIGRIGNHNVPVGIQQFSPPANEEATAYPNPFTGNIRISYGLASEQDVAIKVFNALGHIVYSNIEHDQGSGVHFHDISLGEVLPGIYFYQLSTRSTSYLGKLIKQD